MSALTHAIQVAARDLPVGQSAGLGWIARAVAFVRQIGPYAAIELLLPGGSLIALGLWLYRRYRHAKGQEGAQTCPGGSLSPARAGRFAGSEPAAMPACSGA